jgi:AcrR family transcriptional regulator
VSSVTRRPSSSTRRREAVEQRVLTAVEQLLGSGRSFVELSVQEIADAAGVARSTFYVHFADKTALLIRLAETSMADIFAEAETWMTGDHAGGAAELQGVCRRIIADYRAHEPLLRAVGAATAYDPEVFRWWRSRLQAFIDVTAARLDRAVAEGTADPALPVAPTAAMVVWSIERTVPMTVAVTPATEDDRLAEALARTAWLAIHGR